jgi:transcriptional regulator with XRE-family HTH domain
MSTNTKRGKFASPICDIITKGRFEQRLSQIKLSTLMGYDYNIINHYEGGTMRVKPEDADKLIEHLNLPEDAFAGLDEHFLKEEESKEKAATRIDELVNENLKKLRVQKDLTKRALAEEVDIAATHLSRIENNLSNPTMPQLRTFKKFYGVTWDELMDGVKIAGSSNELAAENEKLKDQVRRLTRNNEALLDQIEELRKK